jgi:flagellar biogenesis protein FliO
MGLSYAVLGVGESSVNLLKELSPEEVESLQPPPKAKNGFQNVLKSVLKR